MANTYQFINSNTVGSGGVSSVTFSSIPSTYTDLVILNSVRTNRVSPVVDGIKIRFNGDTNTANYSERRLYGDGASATTNTEVAFGGYATTQNATASVFANSFCYIPNYTSSNAKSFNVDSVTENNGSTAYQLFDAVLWTGTATISSIVLSPDAGTLFDQYSSFYLYGIKNS